MVARFRGGDTGALRLVNEGSGRGGRDGTSDSCSELSELGERFMARGWVKSTPNVAECGRWKICKTSLAWNPCNVNYIDGCRRHQTATPREVPVTCLLINGQGCVSNAIELRKHHKSDEEYFA